MPGWLSATLVASVTGALLLLIFKYTSNQAAIKRVRNDIDANLFALKLFKDATPVVLAAQAAMIWGAFRLFVLAIVPMLVMMVPVLLMLGQLSLWYQHRPLRVGEEAVVALKLSGNPGDPMPPWPSSRRPPPRSSPARCASPASGRSSGSSRRARTDRTRSRSGRGSNRSRRSWRSAMDS